jgi:two-component system, OmpR family, sensor kinase
VKILKSIKWRLQIWYGLILIAVLVGFGFTAYQLERGRLFRRVDEELQQRTAAVANAMRPPPFRRQNRGQRGPGENFPQRPLPERLPNRPPPPERLDLPPEVDAPEGPPAPDELHTRLEQTGLFDEGNTNGFYYIVQSRDGKDLVRSTNAPTQPVFHLSERLQKLQTFGNRINAPPESPPQSGQHILEAQPPQMRGQFRELIRVRPPGQIIFVGRCIAPELRELGNTAWKLTGIGGAILLLGLAGGWWIASRAMRPIQDISATAAKISAGDLSQRINVGDAENELGQLAATLNSTFSRLETSFAQQRQFTADAAHELRTPLAVILSETQATLKRERGADEYRQSVEVCQRITQRMRRLIESLMELARLDAGQEQMKRMQFDLSGTVRECVELVRPLAEQRGVKIQCDLPGLECAGDPERIAQVVANLLTNAVQYNKPDGEIRVTGQRQNGSVSLTVADTGLGISAEDLPRVFERFYRAEKSRSSGNAGLGLSICKAIVEAHGGTIEISTSIGSGTTFTVRLPVHLA